MFDILLHAQTPVILDVLANANGYLVPNYNCFIAEFKIYFNEIFSSSFLVTEDLSKNIL